LSRDVDRRRYRAVLAYVGTDFHGWQIQRNAPRTVQAVLEEALREFSGDPIRALGAGRTDAGVHADGQVVHFDLSGSREPGEVRDAVNTLLPWDVRVLKVGQAPACFNARRDALWKDYLYRWSRAEVIAPRDSPFVAPLSRGAEAARMAAAAHFLPGRRDFGVFAVRGPCDDSVRTLRSVTIGERGAELTASFRGDGFLRGMVRSICGLLADIGRGRFPPERLREILETGDRRLLAQKAPAKGLTLAKVEYSTDAGAGPRDLSPPLA
jgi:tRNA pseudouridine38-40 synthase